MYYFFVGVFCKEIKENRTSFLGEIVVVSCSTTIVPIWEWHGKNKKENLAIGTNKREYFNDER